MNPELRRDLLAALERPHRLGTIGGDLEEQLAHCAGFSSVLGEYREVVESSSGGGTAIDLGTGGGLPGVALAAMWPQMRWVLVDMRTARADEVERTILKLKLGDRVVVRGVEAQRLGHDAELRASFDVAVARAFGSPDLTAECAAGLVRIGGVLIVSEPPEARPVRGEHVIVRWDALGLAELGFASPVFHDVVGSRFAVLRKVAPTPERFPRMPPRSNRGWPLPR